MDKDCKYILVVDDDPAVRQTMQDVLEIHGYEVVTASDGREAISKLSAMKTLPCLILLDLMMPGMNGWGFLDFQRSNPTFASVPVVLCSAYEASAKSIGIKPVLVKPVQLNSLLGAVKTFCA
jgi:CheY-like chemotaxis protein